MTVLQRYIRLMVVNCALNDNLLRDSSKNESLITNGTPELHFDTVLLLVPTRNSVVLTFSY